MKLSLCILAAALSLSTTIRGADWPQWRGPAFNGTSPDKGLPTTWTEADIKWTTPLPGPSGATPAVWGDSIFVSSPDADENLLLFCLERKSGKVRWQKQLVTGTVETRRSNMASPSPVTNGKLVYMLYGT